jgi:3-dehydroshikimate dehydratase
MTIHMSAGWAFVAASLLAATNASAETFLVNRTDDNGAKHTLRWAIEQSNAINLSNPDAAGNRILIAPAPGARAFVIRPTGDFLPPLVGPVVVQGVSTGAPGSPPAVVLDGSELVAPRTPGACPGATHSYDFARRAWVATRIIGAGPNVRGYYGAGLAVHDSHDVEVTGLEIRNFCAGVAAVRSHNVNVHDVALVDHHGAAGLIFTGDDGNAGITDLSFNNRLANSVLLDNGDGFEFTRGTRDSVAEGNYVALTQPLPEDGNAVEFALPGNNNSLVGNIFTRYRITSVSLNAGGANHVVRDNDISFNSGPGLSVNGPGSVIRNNNISDNGGTAVALTGSRQRFEENIVRRNGGAGISIASSTTAQVTITRNSVAGNAGLGIELAPSGPNPNDGSADCADGFPDCDSGPNDRQNFPVLDASSRWTAGGIVLNGALASRPNQAYTVEFFVSRAADPSGYGEGEVHLGNAMVMTDSSGSASFSVSLPGGDPFGDATASGYFTATATDPGGSTSEFSQALRLSR